MATTQVGSHRGPDGRLAGPHQADQRQVAGGRHGGLGVHLNRLAMAVAATGMILAAVTGQMVGRIADIGRPSRSRGLGQRVASTARAAASMTATGASDPVQRRKACAAWNTSIDKPLWASIPRPRRAANQAVSGGW